MASIAVCLRLAARRLSKAGFWYDDWLMVPAPVSSLLSRLHQPRWVFQAHRYNSSFLRRYALPLFYGVSHLLCEDGCSTVCYELTSNCDATVPKPWLNQTNNSEEGFLTVELICDICRAVVIWIVKSSILAFYWRLFSIRSGLLRVIIWALVVFVTCWAIAMVRPRPSNFKLITMGNSESR